MKLSRRDEILLYLSERPREFRDVMPLGSSQQGVAEALGQARTVISMICTDLELAGLLEVRKAHVDGLSYRVRCYVLTPKAEPFVRLAEQRLKLLEAQAELSDLLSSIPLPFRADK